MIRTAIASFWSAMAPVSDLLLPSPAPDRLISVEVRAVTRQVQARGRQVVGVAGPRHTGVAVGFSADLSLAPGSGMIA